MAFSAQDFIRALKSPSDPPQPGGPTKLEIARKTWDDSSVLVPNKEENIVEWVLTRLLKDKDNHSSSSPLVDLQVWKLLDDVLEASAKPAKGSHISNSRPLRTWLLPLLNRIPTAPILVAFINSVDQGCSSALLCHATRTLISIWPLAVPKISVDTLLDCYAAVTGLFRRQFWTICDTSTTSLVVRLANLVVSSYRSSLAHSNAKKKLYTQFCQHVSSDWLHAISAEPGDTSASSVLADICQAGIDTIFNVDVLRQAQGYPEKQTEDILHLAAESTSDIVLLCLPRIFQSYVVALQKNRNTLFSQSSSRAAGTFLEQARVVSMGFFATCSSILDTARNRCCAWQAKVLLLEVVESQQLIGSRDESGAAALKDLAEKAYGVLVSPDGGQNLPSDSAIRALTIVARVDYELIASIFPRFLRVMAIKPLSVELCCGFLSYLLEYNAKTRSADAVVDLLLQVCGTETFELARVPYKDLHAVSVSGALLHHTFLEKLSKFIHSYTTPGQVETLADHAVRHLHAIADELGLEETSSTTVDGARPRKRTKTEKHTVPKSNKASGSAVASSLTAGIASIVFTSLPLHLLQDDQRRRVLATVQSYYESSMDTLKSAIKQIRNAGHAETWGQQIFVVSLLRLRFALKSARTLQCDTNSDTKLLAKLKALLGVDGILPHVRLEILRFWLLEVETNHSEPDTVFDNVLDLLERWMPDTCASWDGGLKSLASENDGRDADVVATLHTLLDRWLYLFDILATPQQCRRLVNVFSLLQASQPGASGHNTSSINPRDVLQRALHNAVFWEAHNIRDAIVSHVLEATEIIDQINIEAVFLAYRQRSKFKSPVDLLPAIATSFGLLLQAPMEYLPRKARSDLVRRAYAADLTSSVASNGTVDASCVHLVREFLRRTYHYLGSVEQLATEDYLSILMDSFNGGIGSPAGFVSTSLELIKIHLSNALKTAAKNEDTAILSILESFILSESMVTASQDQVDGLRIHAFIALVDILITDHKATEFNQTILAKLHSVTDYLAKWTQPQILALSLPECEFELSSCLPLLQLWRRLLMISSWSASKTTYPVVGRALTTRALASSKPRKDGSMDVFVTILSIVQAELAQRELHGGQADFGLILATYLAFSGVAPDGGHTTLGSCIARACKSMASSDFSSILDLLYEALAAQELGKGNSRHLIQLMDTVMLSAPEGSLKVLQNQLSRCLTVLADSVAFGRGDHLRDPALTFMSSQFNDRPAMIRQQDLSSIWSILGSCLVGSTEHAPATSSTTYSSIVSAISALIRLRRDLVSTTLPHLSFILRRLILVLRRLRPHLGAKQSRIVADTLPIWINPVEPASPDDSKTVARLLTTLQNKTVIRTYGSSVDGQKAESLARPFSKHASHVLSAYIEALNDPFCVLPADIRKELEPGLFALCDMMGEKDRDAMMVASLDAGGKTVLKGIWREYEKQKYTGKG